jgi:ribosome-associated protein
MLRIVKGRGYDTLPGTVEDLEVTPNLVIPAGELRWRAVRASGPGGQNVNKVSTKVELRFSLNESPSLADSVKARLRRLVAGSLDAEGKVVITCQTARTQRQNLEQARELLTEYVRKALVVPRKRRPTKPSKASRAARLRDKRHTAGKKQARRVRSDD